MLKIKKRVFLIGEKQVCSEKLIKHINDLNYRVTDVINATHGDHISAGELKSDGSPEKLSAHIMAALQKGGKDLLDIIKIKEGTYDQIWVCASPDTVDTLKTILSNEAFNTPIIYQPFFDLTDATLELEVAKMKLKTDAMI